MRIWDILTEECQQALTQYQIENFHSPLQVQFAPLEPDPDIILSEEAEADSLTETDKFMRQPPSRSRGDNE